MNENNAEPPLDSITKSHMFYTELRDLLQKHALHAFWAVWVSAVPDYENDDSSESLRKAETATMIKGCGECVVSALTVGLTTMDEGLREDLAKAMGDVNEGKVIVGKTEDVVH